MNSIDESVTTRKICLVEVGASQQTAGGENKKESVCTVKKHFSSPSYITFSVFSFFSFEFLGCLLLPLIFTPSHNIYHLHLYDE
jgi:hypothetical protein